MEGILGPSTRAGPGNVSAAVETTAGGTPCVVHLVERGGVAHHRGIGVRGAVADHAGGSAAGTDALAVSPHGLGMTVPELGTGRVNRLLQLKWRARTCTTSSHGTARPPI